MKVFLIAATVLATTFAIFAPLTTNLLRWPADPIALMLMELAMWASLSLAIALLVAAIRRLRVVA
jgi:hypothetical protein